MEESSKGSIIIELILTNRENLIAEIKVAGALRESDCITWSSSFLKEAKDNYYYAKHSGETANDGKGKRTTSSKMDLACYREQFI